MTTKTNESSQREPGALLGKDSCKFFRRLEANYSNFSKETCLKQMKTLMLMAKSPFWSQILIKIKKQNGWWLPLWYLIFGQSVNNINRVCTPIGLSVQSFKQIGPLWKMCNYDVMAVILDFFSMCTCISNFVKIRPFLTKLEFWRETRFTYDVIAAILRHGRLFNLNWTFSTTCGSGGVVVTKKSKWRLWRPSWMT